MKYLKDNESHIGEQVSYVYHTQMLFKNLFSNTNNYYYVKGTSYDAAGRVTWLGLGADSLPATPLMQSNYTYNPWSTQGGRLLQIQTIVTNTNTIQKLKYNYDPVGDITWIQNHKTGGGIQTQNFTYDALDRLRSSNALGGTGGIYNTETYSYSVATGNMASKAGVGYGYNDPEHAHAVTHLDGVQKYWYDLNGNMTTRIVDGNTYNLSYDAESRLVSVSGTATASFVYDGDGNRVKGTAGGVTTTYIGNYFEWTGSISTSTRYYNAGNQRTAMRVGNGTQTEGVYWLLSDHLGSTTVTADKDGIKYGELRYKAWGENRYTWGSTPTTYRYTGQREESSFGLYFYNARWYDPVLGRFIQSDIITPDINSTKAYDRYSYVYNSPIIFIDPSGNTADCAAWDTWCKIGKPSSPQTIAHKFGVNFISKNGTWTLTNQWASILAVIAVAYSMAYELGNNISGPEAFQKIYNHIDFVWDILCFECKGGGGYTQSPHKIIFASLSQPGGNRSMEMALINARNNVVHELGHAFAQLWYREDGTYDPNGPYFNIPLSLLNNMGFFPSPISASLTWRQHACSDGNSGCSNEIFADMFLGWTFDKWDFGTKMGVYRDNFMTTNMAVWISELY